MPFSGKTLDFLMENRLMDSKAWFHEHKDVFEREVKAPLVELSEALAPTMLRIDPEMEIAPRVGGTLCRVWRDTRFTKDKSLFRDHMWLNFSKNKGVFPGYPGFFADISPDGFSYGCGWWSAAPATMESIRRLILDGHPLFLKAQETFLKQKVYRMEGDSYKRPRYVERPPEEMIWLNRKNLSFTAEIKDFDLIFSDGLARKLKKDLPKLADIYRFLCFAKQNEKSGR